ncbi:MAG: hypothetical protein K9K81_00570 [Desulfobacteraceae bacterium]|nr:hypothetical protein [Desulfobacteraceae bacterium]
MKKILTVLLVAVCLVAFAGTSASAGDKQRHRWEGVAIGVGAAIVGHAIISSYYNSGPDHVTVIHQNRGHRAYPPPRYSRGHSRARGHWKARSHSRYEKKGPVYYEERHVKIIRKGFAQQRSRASAYGGARYCNEGPKSRRHHRVR